MAVYSEERGGLLRLLLGVVVALGALVAVLAVFILVDGDDRAAGVLAVAVAGVLLAASGTSLWLLSRRSPSAKPATVVTGVLSVLSGIALAGSWLALLLPVLGVGLLFLALSADEPARPAGGKGRR